MRLKLITIVLVVLLGVVRVAYAGLEDYGNWFPEGNGTWSLEAGELSVEAGKQQFYVIRKTDTQDNFTLKLRTKTISPYNNDIIIYFCDWHYKLILGGWENTQSGLYRRDRYFTGEWKPLENCINYEFRISQDTWYDIEIQKYGQL